MKWPSGISARIYRDGTVEPQPAGTPVNFWVCCRRDEPWTWRVLSNQHIGACVECDAEIIFSVSEKTPTDARVQKICRRCAERRVLNEGEC